MKYENKQLYYIWGCLKLDHLLYRILLFGIRGGKFKLTTGESSKHIDKFRDDVIFLKENTGIDYVSYIDNYTKYTSDSELFYPDTLVEDIEKVYFLKIKLTEIQNTVSLQNLQAAYDSVIGITRIKNCYKIAGVQ